MTYKSSYALQEGIFAALTNDAAVQSFVGSAVFDALPEGSVPELYILIGQETVRDKSALSVILHDHSFLITIVTHAGGFADAKALSDAVARALVPERVSIANAALITLGFHSCVARILRGGAERRIDMLFRALIEESETVTEDV